MKLEHIGWYQAPPLKISPRIIPKGHQLIEVIISGEVRFTVDGVDTYRPCGSIFWHTPGEKTVFRNNIDNPYSCITFLFLTEAADTRPVPHFTFWNEPSEVVHFCRESLRLFNTDGISLAWLGDYCYSQLRWKAYLYQKQVKELRIPSKLLRIRTYLSEVDLAEVTVETIAESAAISIPYLHQLFLKHMGIPPYQYVLDLKMQRAKLLLASTGELIKAIGFMCGFSSPESFSRSFKQHIGMTPGEYRQKRGPYYRLQ
ncbi:MAG: helix-turn-helix transcriptional regulator [Spirochaetes bacterium]|nr:helix-turn-helix transcriptional regulator [Spirochaetota bacterium]